MPDVTLRTTFIVGFPGEEPSRRRGAAGVHRRGAASTTSGSSPTATRKTPRPSPRRRRAGRREDPPPAPGHGPAEAHRRRPAEGPGRRPGPAPGRRPLARARVGDDRPAGRPGPGNRPAGLPDRRAAPTRPARASSWTSRSSGPAATTDCETGGRRRLLAASPRRGPRPGACRAKRAFARSACRAHRRGFAQKAGHDLIARPVGASTTLVRCAKLKGPVLIWENQSGLKPTLFCFREREEP